MKSTLEARIKMLQELAHTNSRAYLLCDEMARCTFDPESQKVWEECRAFFNTLIGMSDAEEIARKVMGQALADKQKGKPCKVDREALFEQADYETCLKSETVLAIVDNMAAICGVEFKVDQE